MNNISFPEESKESKDNGERTVYWVRCSDRLPTDEFIFIQHQSGYVKLAYHSEIEGNFRSMEDGEIIIGVVAWMKLPKPLKV